MALALALSALAPSRVHALFITNLFSTGVASSGPTFFAGGATDTHWLVNGGATALSHNGQFPLNGSWVNPTGARWIAPRAAVPVTVGATTTSAPGAYAFSTTFTLPVGFSNANIQMRIAADDSLNNVQFNATAFPSISFAGVTPNGWSATQFNSTIWTITSGFVAGTNTLTFNVTNFAGNAGNPTGILVEFISATYDLNVVPGPSGLICLASGLISLGAFRWRGGRWQHFAVSAKE